MEARVKWKEGRPGGHWHMCTKTAKPQVENKFLEDWLSILGDIKCEIRLEFDICLRTSKYLLLFQGRKY